MITNIWLKSQPNKKHSYPDCYPDFFMGSKTIHIKNNESITQSTYAIVSIERIEFRP